MPDLTALPARGEVPVWLGRAFWPLLILLAAVLAVYLAVAFHLAAI